MLQTTHSDDPNVQEKIDKLAKRDRKTEQFFRWALKIMEWIIAGITLIALVGALGIEVVNMVTEGTAYFADVSHMLHNLLSIVVGLEFVRMLIDTTPANILEVLTVAITRHVILSHDDPWSNAACTGYCLLAMQRAGLDEKTIEKVLHELHWAFDDTSVQQAEKIYCGGEE